MNQQQRGSGFTNIQNILSANQGNKLGQAVGTGVQNVANQANTGLQKQKQDFQAGTQQGLTTLGNEKTNEQSVLQNPTNASDQDVKNFSNYRSGQYAGPKDLGDITGLQNKAQEAEQLGRAGQSTGGRLGLLQRFVGQGNQYNAGQQNLDNLLLGQNANKDLSQARRSTFGLGNKVNTAQQAAQGTGQAVQGQYQNFADKTNQDIHAQQDPVMQQLAAQSTAAQQAKDARAAQIQQGLASGSISAEDAQMLGLDANQDIGNLDLNRFLTVDPTKASAQNVANSQQTAQLNALSRLGGQDAFSADPTQAGTFGQNQFKYDKNALAEAAAQNQSNFNNNAGTYKNLRDQAVSGGSDFLNLINQGKTQGTNFGGDANAGTSKIYQSLQQFGIDPTDPNAFTKLANIYQQSQNNQYTGQGSSAGQIGQGGGNYGKDISEGIFGNQNGYIAQGGRDAMIKALNQYNQNSQAYNDMSNQYGIGRKLQINPGASTNMPQLNQLLNPNA